MLEIRDFEGSTEELVAFVNRVWEQAYRGKMSFPRWSVEYFDWQFRLGEKESRRNLIAAYDGGKLGGVLLGTRYPFRTPAGLIEGGQWSWLSIGPESRGKGIATKLDEERIKRQQEDGVRLVVSFRFVGSKHSLAERPDPKAPDPKFNRKIGFWARVIEPGGFSRWHLNPVEGFLARLAGPLARIPEGAKHAVGIREYRVTDLDRCVALAEEAHRGLGLSIAWDRKTLGHQLGGGGISQTMVVEDGGEVQGFINFHLLPFHGRTLEPVGIIDLIVMSRTHGGLEGRLINAALRKIRSDGGVLTLKLRSGDSRAWPLVQTHFVPEGANSHLVLQPIGEGLKFPQKGAVHILWR